MAQIARLVRIRGRVQGVFFRAWTRDQAQRLGVAGWVRNCPDGSVEAHLEGEKASVEKMVVRLREGPPHAQVMAIEVTEGELENLSAFKVQH